MRFISGGVDFSTLALWLFVHARTGFQQRLRISKREVLDER
ncbi:MAG: hypothetical protein PHD74_05305 [Candidatus Krumholzibacteria bacterium]|nr:hypothetical protein [Candidatus Krumholzibacteria bacterium]